MAWRASRLTMGGAWALVAAALLVARAVAQADDGRVVFDATDPIDAAIATAPRCPETGSFEELKRAGNRLLFEKRFFESAACYKAAMRVYVGAEEARPRKPLEALRFRQLYSKSYNLPDELFDSLHTVRDMVERQRSADYSIKNLHLAPQEDDYVLHRVRPPPWRGKRGFED